MATLAVLIAVLPDISQISEGTGQLIMAYTPHRMVL
jgi:hypothetical protein